MARIVYADNKIKKSFKKLELRDKEFFDHVKNAMRNIAKDPACGIKLSKKLIPKEFIKKYQINNLYKYNLPNAWRLLYSLTGAKVELLALILSCLNHKQYEKKFKY